MIFLFAEKLRLNTTVFIQKDTADFQNIDNQYHYPYKFHPPPDGQLKAQKHRFGAFVFCRKKPPAEYTAGGAYLITILLNQAFRLPFSGDGFYYLGSNTASMTCTTPLLASISATLTFTSLMKTPLSLIVTVTSAPLTVAMTWPSFRSVESALAPTAW